MFWVTLALGSALFLGFYDIAKKKALTGNAVLPVLFFVSLTCAALLSPAYFLGQIPLFPQANISSFSSRRQSSPRAGCLPFTPFRNFR